MRRLDGSGQVALEKILEAPKRGDRQFCRTQQRPPFFLEDKIRRISDFSS
jgi:hypothetical protein